MARRRSTVAVVLAGVTVLGLVTTTAVLLRPTGTPRQLRAAAEVTAAPVGHEEFADERTVKVSLKRTTAPPLVVGLTGRVTATSCQVGRELVSGRAVATVNDRQLIALATSIPLYRDLRAGDKGDDVRALQQELARLGYRPETKGTFGSGTTRAVKALQKAAGVGTPDGTVSSGQILWLPAAAVVPESCELVQGAYVGSGQVYAKIAAQLTAVVLESVPTNVVAGERTIRMMGVTGPLGADSTATDQAFLGKVMGTQEYRLLSASGKEPDLSAVIALKNRLRTLKVPPGALFGIDGDRGCVQSGSTAYPVKIISSRLGVTLIVLAGATPGDPPDQVDLGSSITHTGCG